MDRHLHPPFKPIKILKKYFGYQQFRTNQQAIITAILQNKDMLAIQPTGSGKSLCFQIPALCLPGTTVVISPLISLMADQVSTLQKKGIKATFLNSSLQSQELSARLERLANQYYQLLYVAPERLFSSTFRKAIAKIKIPLVAIDEAHCASLWGHDFRPHYLSIKQFANEIEPRPTVAAFTATANNKIKQDLTKVLGLNQPQIFTQSLVRTNLNLNVINCPSQAAKQLAIIKILKKHQPNNHSGLIYTTTRKSTHIVANLIKQLNFNQQLTARTPLVYHGGLSDKQRAQTQQKFLDNDNQIICATNAFGMGIDKANIRFVIHYQIPANIENYYQEVGRAGRDGQTSHCYLLFHRPDIAIHHYLINNSKNNNRQLIKENKLKQMINFATEAGCLSQKISTYFDQSLPTLDCCCSHCLPNEMILDESEEQRLFSLNKHQILSKLPQQTRLLLAILNPTSFKQLSAIPGIGQGLLQKLAVI